MRIALDWTRPMHNEMARCLATYTARTYGEAAVFRAIRELSSSMAFCEERQRRLNVEMARQQATQVKG